MTNEEALSIKLQGNSAYSNGNFSKAEEIYSKAIETDPRNAVFFRNRSFARVKQEKWLGALEDANNSIELDAENHKAWYLKVCNFFLIYCISGEYPLFPIFYLEVSNNLKD